VKKKSSPEEVKVLDAIEADRARFEKWYGRLKRAFGRLEKARRKLAHLRRRIEAHESAPKAGRKDAGGINLAALAAEPDAGPAT
jgi:hypothetical protein